MTTETKIAADMARYREFLAAAEAGDPYAKMNAEAYAARLKRMGASIHSEAAPTVVVTPAAPPAPASKPTPPVPREEAIRRIGTAHGTPDEMIAAALADGTPAADFAVAVAEHVEIERVAQRIVRS